MKDNRIYIFGLTASGKTTLAKDISKIKGIKIYPTDEMVYKKKWDLKYSEKTRNKKLRDVHKKSKWIIEGVHHDWAKSAIKKADIVILLNPSKITMLKRAFKRSKENAKKGKRDKLKQKVKLVYGIFRWTTKGYKDYKKQTKKFIELKNKKDIESFLKALK